MVVLPLRTIKNMARKGFIYAISADIYAHRFALSGI